MKQKLGQAKETIVRIWGNIKWLLNHPITGWTSNVPSGVKCDYCGADNSFITYSWQNARRTVCWNCIFKALDKGLLNK